MWMNAADKGVYVVNKIVSTHKVHIIASVIEDTPYTVMECPVQVSTNVLSSILFVKKYMFTVANNKYT